jgi:hypothetical protein
MPSVRALAYLGWRALVAHPLKRAFRQRGTGLERFSAAYVSEGLVPTRVEDRAVAEAASASSVIVFVDSSMSALPEVPQETSSPGSESRPPAKPRMSTRNRLLFFATGWLIVLMPFLFWWNTWFGRQLSDKQLAEYLQDDKKPRHIQHALVQIGERVTRHDTVSPAGIRTWCASRLTGSKKSATPTPGSWVRM